MLDYLCYACTECVKLWLSRGTFVRASLRAEMRPEQGSIIWLRKQLGVEIDGFQAFAIV